MDIAGSGSKGTIWRTFGFIVYLLILMNLFNHSHYSSHDKSCVITCYAGHGWNHRTCHPENLVCPSASLLGIAWFLRFPRAYNFNHTPTNKQLIFVLSSKFWHSYHLLGWKQYFWEDKISWMQMAQIVICAYLYHVTRLTRVWYDFMQNTTHADPCPVILTFGNLVE